MIVAHVNASKKTPLFFVFSLEIFPWPPQGQMKLADIGLEAKEVSTQKSEDFPGDFQAKLIMY